MITQNSFNKSESCAAASDKEEGLLIKLLGQ